MALSLTLPTLHPGDESCEGGLVSYHPIICEEINKNNLRSQQTSCFSILLKLLIPQVEGDPPPPVPRRPCWACDTRGITTLRRTRALIPDRVRIRHEVRLQEVRDANRDQARK